MKKLIFFLSSLIFTVALEAACDRKIDNSKVIMFVDVNQSDLEIATAEKAACERGQKLVIIPKNYKAYGETLNKKIKAEEKYKEISIKLSNYILKRGKDTSSKENISPEEMKIRKEFEESIKAFTKANKDQEDFNFKQVNFSDQIKEELNQIRKNKGTLENFTISGHDGGGTFGGSKANLSRGSIGNILEDYKDINQVKSLLLLGCYTGVPKEILDWMTIFPDLRIVGGYDGSAPLAVRPEGHDYLYNLLTKEKKLTSAADQKKIQSVLDTSFKSLKNLHASMYVKPLCQNVPIDNEKSYFYGAVSESDPKLIGQKSLREFKMQDCANEAKKMKADGQLFLKYYSGELEPPLDTSSGELRSLYTNARRLEHCRSLNLGADPSRTFGLLFYDGMKKSFAKFYKNDLEQVQNNLNTLTQAELDEEYNRIIKDQETIKKTADELGLEIEKLEKTPEKYFADKQIELDKKKNEYEKFSSNPKYKDLLIKFPELNLDSVGTAMSGGGIFNSTEEMNNYLELRDKSMLLLSEINSLKEKKSRPLSEVSSELKNKQVHYLDLYKSQLKRFENSKLTIEGVKGKIWVPTSENLAGKTRKEILTNINTINGLVSSGLLPPKIRRELSWTQAVSQKHLNHMNSPFSWHELNSTVEAPPVEMSLKKYKEGSGYSSFGW